MLDFDSFDFFANLFPLVLVILPLYRWLKNAVARRLLLSVCGLYLLISIAPRLALFYVGFWLVVWVLQQVLAATSDHRRAGKYLAVAVFAVLLPMLIWKVDTATFVIQFNLRFNSLLTYLPGPLTPVDLVRNILLPLGLSFSTFRGIDLLIKTSLGVFGRLPLNEVFFYGFFPPVLLIGPVIQYTEIQKGVEPGRTIVWNDLRVGMLLVASGLFKIFGVSFFLQNSSDMFVFYGSNAPLTLWFDLVRFALYFYFNFAGYSDLAIGAAAMLGFTINRNFDWPFTKTNPQAFWNSWHMSLTHFVQRNVFIPVGGMRRESQYRAIFLSMMVIALWHNVSIPLILFGLYHTVGLIGHRVVAARRPPKPDEGLALVVPKALVQFAFVAVSLPLLVLNSNQLIPFYSSLMGLQ